LVEGISGKVVGLSNREIKLMDYGEVLAKKKVFSKKLVQLAELLGR
jgi:hypothetical protein